MISKNKIKFVNSLTQKKKRYAEGLFVAEGQKSVIELLSAFECVQFYYTAAYEGPKPDEAELVDATELRQLSSLEAPSQVLAVFRMPLVHLDVTQAQRNLVLAVDGVQDAGNLGTLLRVADWFGIDTVWCSKGTVDVYNGKTVQATMGALARVHVCYVDLPDLLAKLDTPIYTTSLQGRSIYECPLSATGVVVVGNEGNGISPEVMRLGTQSLLLPSFPAGRKTSESLNVGVAAAVICAEFRRREM